MATASQKTQVNSESYCVSRMINPCGLGPVSRARTFRITQKKRISNRKEQGREAVPRLETL